MRREKRLANHARHEILPVKDYTTGTTKYIVVRNVGQRAIVTQYGGRKFYRDRSHAQASVNSSV